MFSMVDLCNGIFNHLLVVIGNILCQEEYVQVMHESLFSFCCSPHLFFRSRKSRRKWKVQAFLLLNLEQKRGCMLEIKADVPLIFVVSCCLAMEGDSCPSLTKSTNNKREVYMLELKDVVP